MRITTVSSGFTTTQAFTSGVTGAASRVAARAGNGMWKPRVKSPAPASRPRRVGRAAFGEALDSRLIVSLPLSRTGRVRRRS